MNRANGKNGRKKPRFRVGDWVQWGVGDIKRLAVVIEDEGAIGLNQKQWYRLREYPLWTDVMEYGLSEEFLEPAPRPEKLPEPHDKVPVP